MKVLTIKQPWATLIAKDIKEYELRSWKTNYRGELLIHAGKSIDNKNLLRLKEFLNEDIPTSGFVAKAVLADCIEITENFKNELLKLQPEIYKNACIGEFAWKLKVIEVINVSEGVKGKLGLWNYDGEMTDGTVLVDTKRSVSKEPSPLT